MVRSVMGEIKLTDRQRRFLLHMAAGLTDDLIACQEGMTKCKAHNRINQLIHKLGAHNRTHAVAVALVLGLITLEDLRGTV